MQRALDWATRGAAGLLTIGAIGIPHAAASAPVDQLYSVVKPWAAIDDPELRTRIATSAGGRADEDRFVTVEVLYTTGAEPLAESSITAAGGVVTGTAPGTLIQAAIPTDAVVALGSAPGVAYLRAPDQIALRPHTPGLGVPNSGPLTTEAVQITNANAWHTAGYRGTGTRVGIIDFFNESRWNIQQSNGEVPAVAGTFCLDEGRSCSVWDPRETGHGNAVAEIIHDLAPDSQVYLAQAGTLADSYALINWFAENGVTIINRSLGSPYDGPGNGTGPLDALADYAVSRGMTWFNSAGNEGNQQYWRGSWVDADLDGWLDFGPGDESLNVNDPTLCAAFLGARWNDWGPPSTRTDYDFYVFSGDSMVYPSGAPPDQRRGAPPIELAGLDGCTDGPMSIRVRKWADGDGTDGDVLELLTYSGDLEYSQSAGSASSPIVDSANRGVVAVGAVDPPLGGAIGSYSSQGPTNDGRRKPDVSAPACFVSSVYRMYNTCFNGTSAAAPAAAGVAALLASAGLAASPEGLAALLKHSIVDRGPAGPDNVYGTGELRLPAPPTGAVTATPARYVPLTPTRVVDTRRALGPLARHLEPEEIMEIPLAGHGVVPADAVGVAMNVTIVGAQTSGYVQAIPTMWAPVDASSSINLDHRGQILPNFVISPVGAGGQVSIYAPSGGDLLIDVLGYFTSSGPSAAGRIVALDPQRVLDTRQSVAARPDLVPPGWIDHQPATGEIVPVRFDAATGLPAGGVAAVVVNITATGAPADGFITAFPGGPVPDASTVNLVAGGTSANTTIVPLGADRTIRLFSSSGAHVIVDLIGYVTSPTAPVSSAGLFVPIAPTRRFDSRAGELLVSGQNRLVTLAGAPIPPNAEAVSLNVTVTRTKGTGGYVSLSPAGRAPLGEFSSVNWSHPGETVANGSLVKLHAGMANATSFQDTDLILDVNGYFLAED